MRIHDQLISAQFENLTADPSPTATTIGRGIFRTDTGEFKVQINATTWASFADLISAQTMQNKILQSPEITNGATYVDLGSTPANPIAGKLKFYSKAGKLFTLNPAGEEIEVGADAAPTTTISGTAPGTVGQLVYNTGSAWALADHTDIDKVATAMIVEVEAGEYKIQTSGPVEITGHGFTVGDYYFGDKATLGGVTATKPSTLNDISKSVFHVQSADVVELLLQNEPILVAAENPTFTQAPFLWRRATSGQAIAEGTQTFVQFNSPQRSAPFINSDLLGSIFTIQEDGLYDISGIITLAAGSAVGITSEFSASVLVNGVNEGSGFNARSTSNSSVSQNGNQGVSYRLVRDLVVGDTITIAARTDNSSNISRSLISAGTLNYLQILRVPDLIS